MIDFTIGFVVGGAVGCLIMALIISGKKGD